MGDEMLAAAATADWAGPTTPAADDAYPNT